MARAYYWTAIIKLSDCFSLGLETKCVLSNLLKALSCVEVVNGISSTPKAFVVVIGAITVTIRVSCSVAESLLAKLGSLRLRPMAGT